MTHGRRRIVGGSAASAAGLLVLSCANVLGFEDSELRSDGAAGKANSDAGTLLNAVAGSRSNDGGGAQLARLGQGGASLGTTGQGGAAERRTGGGGAGLGSAGEGGAGEGACGNGRIDPGEECDGLELGEATCVTLPRANAAGGQLGCTSECHYDIDDCYHVSSLDLMLHVCARLSNGRVKCWGSNFSGQLGLGDMDDRGTNANHMGEQLPFVDLGGPRALEVTTGFEHTCALLEGGKVKCWGSNANGQLGVTNERVLDPSSVEPISLGASGVTSVVAGGYHNCALFESGGVKCWGRNDHGQLGLGHKQDRGALAGEMGDGLPFVDLGTNADGEPERADALELGFDHTCVLTTSATVKCWGSNFTGQLARAPSVANHGDGPSELGKGLKALPITGMVERFSAGGWHNCASTGALSLNCWGANDAGQLGAGEPQFPLLEVSLGSGLYIDGIALGHEHSCAWFADELKCWGRNDSGQLGLGDVDSRGIDPEQMGDNLPFVNLGAGRALNSVHAGHSSTCAILDGRVKCWGLNSLGALGAGHQEPLGVSPEQMGDALPFVAL